MPNPMEAVFLIFCCVAALPRGIASTCADGNVSVVVVGVLIGRETNGEHTAMTAAVELAFEEARTDATGLAPFKIDRSPALMPGLEIILAVNWTATQQRVGMENALLMATGQVGGNQPLGRSVDVVIGASWSSVSMVVNNALSVFNIPQISASSTSGKLSDTNLFPTFMRSASPDSMQTEALARLVSSLGWPKVATLATDGVYAAGLAADFRKAASKHGITTPVNELIVPLDEAVLADASSFARFEREHDDDIANALEAIYSSGVRVVLLSTASDADARRILRHARDRGMLTHEWAWIGTDGWLNLFTFSIGDADAEIQGFSGDAELRDLANGIFGTVPYAGAGSEAHVRFEERFKASLAVQRRTRNIPTMVPVAEGGPGPQISSHYVVQARRLSYNNNGSRLRQLL